MRIALVHDYLIQYGGAERTLEVLHSMFPDAPVYTSIYKPRAMPSSMRSWDMRVSFLQKTVFASKWHRMALPLYPFAFECMNLKEYDIIISSSSAFAKGIIPSSSCEHICYLHSPMRFAWDTQQYLDGERIAVGAHPFLEWVLHRMRIWDVASSHRVDRFIANSREVQYRVSRYYRRESDVIYPPVDVKVFPIRSSHADYYLILSRFAPYKRIDLALEALKKLDMPCYIVGEGRQRRELEKIAGEKTHFTGRVSDEDLRTLIAESKALIVPGKEDFGIAAVEANAAGVPVISYAAGGALETQVEGVTGTFFKEQTVEDLCYAVLRLDNMKFDSVSMHLHAMKFDRSVFVDKIKFMLEDISLSLNSSDLHSSDLSR